MPDLFTARVSFAMVLEEDIDPLQGVLKQLQQVPYLEVKWAAPGSAWLTSANLLLSLVYQGVEGHAIFQEDSAWRDLLYTLELRPWCLDCMDNISTSDILGHNNDHKQLWVRRSEILQLGHPARVPLYAARPRRESYYRTFLQHVRSDKV